MDFYSIVLLKNRNLTFDPLNFILYLLNFLYNVDSQINRLKYFGNNTNILINYVLKKLSNI